MSMGNSHQSLVKFIQGELAHHRSVVIGDTDHSDATPRQVMGDPQLLQSLAQSGGTLILEGPTTNNARLQDYYSNKISGEELMSHSPYQSNDPAKAAEWKSAYTGLLDNAKTAGAHVYYPEDGTAYKALANDPVAEKTFEKISGEVTSMRCASVQLPYIFNALNP